MDTVYVLVGKIGMQNLSSNAQSRLKKLNELDESLTNLKKALAEAEKKDQALWERKVEEAQTVYDNFEADFQVFLDLEYKDLLAKRTAKEEAEANAKEQAEAKAKADAEAKAKADAEAEAEAQRQAQHQPPAPPAETKKGKMGIGTIFVGALVGLVTFGAITIWKNK